MQQDHQIIHGYNHILLRSCPESAVVTCTAAALQFILCHVQYSNLLYIGIL